MKNCVFISPNFPTNYWKFCHELKNNGLNVLGVGDQPYDELSQELKGSLTEYYKVDSLENYDEVYRAVAFFRLQIRPDPLAGVQQRVLAGAGRPAPHRLPHYLRLSDGGHAPDQV